MPQYLPIPIHWPKHRDEVVPRYEPYDHPSRPWSDAKVVPGTQTNQTTRSGSVRGEPAKVTFPKFYNVIKLFNKLVNIYCSLAIGHFTQMIHADTTEIGCALVRFYKHHNNLRFLHYYLVCNYSEGNIENRPVYRKGKRCSRCKNGCTRGKYRCLCRDWNTL